MSILIVDDQLVIADALAAVLRTHTYVIAGVAYCSDEAVQLSRQIQPEYILLDLRMKTTLDDKKPSEEKGLEALRTLHAAHPNTKIVILSNTEEYQADLARILVQCRQAGARAFMHKAQDTSTLLGILAILRTSATYFTPEQYELMLAYNPQAAANPLTSREMDVLNLVVHGFMDKNIATELEIAVGTVRKHLESIYSKLHVGNRTEAIHVAREQGLLP